MGRSARRRRWVWGGMALAVVAAGCGEAREGTEGGEAAESSASASELTYRQQLGADNAKIMEHEGRTYVWADGDVESPPGEGRGEWFDFTDAPIPVEELQYGIGIDRIPSIDDPVFVEPDDPRLLQIPPSPYRPDERPTAHEEIPVIGYVEGGEARAYPVALLDRHEVVNDEIRGKPVSVGW